jgi:hypothetical protein
LTAARRIKPTSPRCHSAWQPNPGRGSTYRRGNSVQTTGTSSDNRIAELSHWDRDILAIEYQALDDLQFDDIEVTGLSLGEIDLILDEASEKKPVGPGPEDDLPQVVAAPVSRKGDLWILGSHRLLCGDARCDSDYARLLEGERADLVLTDPPFNVKIDGNVSG